jgi:hypothetical protein
MLFSIESMRAPRVGVSKVTSTGNPTRIIKTFSHCDAVKEIDKFVTIAGLQTPRGAQEVSIAPDFTACRRGRGD